MFASYGRQSHEQELVAFTYSFEHYNLKAFLRQFEIVSVKRGIIAMEDLSIPGAIINYPFNQLATKQVHALSPEAEEIGTIDTVRYVGSGFYWGYNVTWQAVREILNRYSYKRFFILGDGNLSKAVQYAAQKTGKEFKLITRENWNSLYDLREELIFNATPLGCLLGNDIHRSNTYIENSMNTEQGREIHLLRTAFQFDILTGLPMPLLQVKKHLSSI